MAANGRFGGHIVSGHIDGTGEIAEITPAHNSTWYRIKTSPKLMRYIIEKGSITIDGISLTVVDTNDEVSACRSFRIRLRNQFRFEKIGSIVNLENDIVGKYIEQFLLKSRRMNRK
ncbi:riboflavin synthase subunit alpha [Actinobacillus equuli]|nr:riboflavin synthase subunit alpha [Actinobacillus equuli]